MPYKDGHANAGCNNLDLWIEDLLGFNDHLPFFLGEAIIKETVDMRDHIEGDLLSELLRLGRIAHKDVA